MFYIFRFVLLLGAAVTSLFASHSKREWQQNPSNSSVRIVPVASTFQPSNAQLIVAYPQQGQLQDKSPLLLNFRVRGFAVGCNSAFPRSEEILDHPDGQTVNIIIDNEHYYPYSGTSINALDDNGDFYERTYQFSLPYHLKPGVHLIRMYLARSYGESLKSADCFFMTYFHVGQKQDAIQINQPILSYNEPSPRYSYEEKMPILLDFLVHNCQLSKDGWRVIVQVDNKQVAELDQLGPYYIYGLKKGRHKVTLELKNAHNKHSLPYANCGAMILVR